MSISTRTTIAASMGAMALGLVHQPSLAQAPGTSTSANVNEQRNLAVGVQGESVEERRINNLDDIVVTARRVEENLQTVPLTASAFNSDALRAASIGSPQDLQQSIAGVYLAGTGSPANAQYAIRGTSKPVAGAGAPGVVSYFADVPLPAYVSSTPQYDLSSIQVLKGPQGTLFGRNTTGGAVLIYPTLPTFHFDGYIQATVGNYSTRSVEGALNIPVIPDRLSLRFAGRIDRSDGTVRNLGVGGDLANQHDNNFRASILMKPTDWVTNTTIFDYAEQPASQGKGAAQVITSSGLPIPSLQAMIAQQNVRGGQVVDTGLLDTFEGWHSWGISNRTDVELPNVTITNILGYRNVYYTSLSNFDGLPGSFFEAYQSYRNRQYSEELQVKGRVFDDRLSWLFGAFYADNPPAVNAGDSDLSDLGAPDAPLIYTFYSEESTALFANLSFEVVPGVTLNGGYRYTWDRFAACSGNGELNLPAGVRSGECMSELANPSMLKGRSRAPTWTIGADWQVNRDVFLYLTSRRGYKTGGLNTPLLGNDLREFQTFRPEKTTDVEIGAKSNFTIGDMRTRFNVSAFRTKTTNQQLIGTQVSTSTYQAASLACVPPEFNPFIDGDCDSSNDPARTILTINGGSTTTTGVELEGMISPIPGLTLSAAGTFIDSKTNKYVIPALVQAFFPQGSIPLLFTPKQTYTAAVSYESMLGNLGRLSVDAQYYHSGKVDFYGYVAPSYDVINLRFDLNGVGGSNLDAGVFVRNLLDEDYVTAPALASVAAIPANTVLFGTPRTYGLQIRYRFGQSGSR